MFSHKCWVNDPSWPFLNTIGTDLQPIWFTPCDTRKWPRALDIAAAMGSDNNLTLVLKTCTQGLTQPLGNTVQYSYNTGNYLTRQKIVQKKQSKSNYLLLNLTALNHYQSDGNSTSHPQKQCNHSPSVLPPALPKSVTFTTWRTRQTWTEPDTFRFSFKS